MIDAVFKTLTQMFSPPFRHVLLKSIGLALIMIVLLGIGMYYGFSLAGGDRRGLGPKQCRRHAQQLLDHLVWILSFVAGLGIITGGIFLMPAVTAFVGSFFVDEIADQVEGTYYPADMPGVALPFFARSRKASRRRC